MAYAPASDKLSSFAASSVTPARNVRAVTPSDTVDLSPYAKALYVGTGGVVQVITVEDYQAGVTTPQPMRAVSGGILPAQVARVMATSTTAADIVALYS